MISGLKGKIKDSGTPRDGWEVKVLEVLYSADISEKKGAGDNSPNVAAGEMFLKVAPESVAARIVLPEFVIKESHFQPDPVRLEVSFQVAHDLVAFGDCYCGSEAPFAGDPGGLDQCIHHALLSALYAATGNPLYAGKESESDGK